MGRQCNDTVASVRNKGGTAIDLQKVGDCARLRHCAQRNRRSLKRPSCHDVHPAKGGPAVDCIAERTVQPSCKCHIPSRNKTDRAAGGLNRTACIDFLAQQNNVAAASQRREGIQGDCLCRRLRRTAGQGRRAKSRVIGVKKKVISLKLGCGVPVDGDGCRSIKRRKHQTSAAESAIRTERYPGGIDQPQIDTGFGNDLTINLRGINCPTGCVCGTDYAIDYSMRKFPRRSETKGVIRANTKALPVDHRGVCRPAHVNRGGPSTDIIINRC